MLKYITGIAGTLTLVAGLALAAALCAPVGGAGEEGLHRWTPPDGQQVLIYGHGLSAYFSPVPTVLTSSAVLVVVGGSLLFGARRFQRALP
jgi:hypothetical protein